jgi:hypothetical protein
MTLHCHCHILRFDACTREDTMLWDKIPCENLFDNGEHSVENSCDFLRLLLFFQLCQNLQAEGQHLLQLLSLNKIARSGQEHIGLSHVTSKAVLHLQCSSQGRPTSLDRLLLAYSLRSAVRREHAISCCRIKECNTSYSSLIKLTRDKSPLLTN